MRRELSYAGLVTAAILSASDALGAGPTLLGVRSGVTGAETRIVLDLSAPADLLIQQEMEGRSFRIVAMAPAAQGAKSATPSGSPDSVALRRLGALTSTVSVDTARPMALKSVSLLAPEPGLPYRAVFDLGPAVPGDRILVGVPWASSPTIARPDSATLLRLAPAKHVAFESTAFAAIADHEGDSAAWLTLARVALAMDDSGGALVAVERARLLASLEANRARILEAQDLSAQILAESTLVPTAMSAAVVAKSAPRPAPAAPIAARAQQQVAQAPRPASPPATKIDATPKPNSATQLASVPPPPSIAIGTVQPPAPPAETIQAAPVEPSNPPHPRVLASTMRRQLASANAQLAASDPRIGVAGAVNPATTGSMPGDQGGQILQIGNDIAFRERIVTDTGGQTQILFLDHSAMTVGSNADITIDEFIYDPNTGTGKLAMSATVGVFRYVGGKISKDGNVTIKTPIATIGVRGGIAYINVEASGRTQATLGFGAQLTVTGINGATQTITKPGFAVTVEAPAQGTAQAAAPPPSAPSKAPAASLTSMVQNVEATTSNPTNTVLAVTRTSIDERLAPQVTVGAPQSVFISPSSVINASSNAPATQAVAPTVNVTQITNTIERSVQAQAVVATDHAVIAAVTSPTIATIASTPRVTSPTIAPTVPTLAPTTPTIAPTIPTLAPTIPSIASVPTIAPTVASVVTVPVNPSLPTLPSRPTGP